MPARVLVVDDDEAMLRLLERRIQSAGYEVVTAHDGEEAIRRVLVDRPPVVITDWSMPNMDGLEFCRVMRALHGIGFIYIIIITAQTEEDRVVEAFEAGADDFLHKPLRQQELLARLKAAMRIVQLEQDLDRQNRSIRNANNELLKLNGKLEDLARTDPLTGLSNRREAMAILSSHWAQAGRHNLSCMLIDIDHFKRLNDQYGHDFGDRVLCQKAVEFRRVGEGADAVCRIGGEEFLVVCPDRCLEETARLARELCRDVRSTPVCWNGVEANVTISIGVAQRDRMTCTPDQLLKKADEALYAAKQAGRDRVCVAGHLPVLAECMLPDAPPALNSRLPLLEQPAKVLVVDDDRSIRILCRRLLETSGYTVVEANEGNEALAKVAAEKPDVIVVDANMPGMDGLTCSRRLKTDPDTRDIPIIMASGLGDEDNIVAGLEAGVDEYITKPIRRREFVLRVQSMARLYRSKLDLLRACETRDEQANALATLLEYSASISGSMRIDDVLDKTIKVTARLLHSRRISIMLPDSDGRTLSIAKAMGIDPTVAATVRVPKGADIAGWVFAEQEPVVINSPSDARNSVSRYDSAFFASVPLISHPLIGAEHAIGVLNITDRDQEFPFQPREVKYIQLISSIAAANMDDILTRRARDEARDSIVRALATLAEYRDTDTGRHLERVTRFSLLLAEELRGRAKFTEAINVDFLSDLRRAVPLHDIGKVAIPDSILLKPGQLTPEEMQQMKRHTEIGAQAIRSVLHRATGVRFLKMAEDIACSHHEWYDGCGYPHGLKSESIPLSARITALADVYDALTTKRVYKDAFSHQTAIDIIRSRCGSQFDPDVGDAFLKRESDFSQVAAELADVVVTEPSLARGADKPAAVASN